MDYPYLSVVDPYIRGYIEHLDILVKVKPSTSVVAITSVYPDSGLFLLGAECKGTVRLIPDFAPNKSMDGSGKLAMKCRKLVGETTIEQNYDHFTITCQGKIMRFKTNEVPGTKGAILGALL